MLTRQVLYHLSHASSSDMHIYKAKIIAIPTIFLQQIICTLYLKWDVMTAKESDEKQTLIRLWSQFAQI
jgi:predicted ABC-type exoprotein transport system permease subunit